MERMNEASENTEIWWDSSPLIFESWKHKRIKSKPLETRDEEEDLLDRYYISERPMEQLFRGVTTNPPLSGAVIKDDPGFWRELSIEIKRKNPGFSTHQVWWEVYKEVVKRVAEKYLGVFRQSNYRYGCISGQVDPIYCGSLRNDSLMVCPDRHHADYCMTLKLNEELVVFF